MQNKKPRYRRSRKGKETGPGQSAIRDVVNFRQAVSRQKKCKGGERKEATGQSLKKKNAAFNWEKPEREDYADESGPKTTKKPNV